MRANTRGVRRQLETAPRTDEQIGQRHPSLRGHLCRCQPKCGLTADNDPEWLRNSEPLGRSTGFFGQVFGNGGNRQIVGFPQEIGVLGTDRFLLGL